MYIGPFFPFILVDFYCILAVTNKEMKQILVLVQKKSLLATARRTLIVSFIYTAHVFLVRRGKDGKGVKGKKKRK